MGNKESVTPMAIFKEHANVLRNEEEIAKMLPPSLMQVARGIREGRFENIVVLVGAGISVSAGIPDFRTPGTGLYSNLEKYNLPSPEAIFDIDFFAENPYPFFRLATELYPGKFRPTPTHHFLRLLSDKGVLLRCYTQNIDTLESEAGLPEDKYVACHGNFASNTCTRCSKSFPQKWMERAIFGPEGDSSDVNSVAGAMAQNAKKIPLPRCDNCNAVVKPDITFFGENLPERFQQCLKVDVQCCDLLLIMGTSLQVYPVASLPDIVPHSVPRVLFNRDPVHIAKKYRSRDVARKSGLISSDDDASDGEAGDNEVSSGIGSNSSSDSGSISSSQQVGPVKHTTLTEDEELVDTGFWFELSENYRDVFAQGNCDDTVTEFVGLLGWEEEFEALVTAKAIAEQGNGDRVSAAADALESLTL